MGIAPVYWGPHVWAAIHLICLGAPESFSGSDTSGYRAFFVNLASILPCEACGNHLRQNLKETSIEAALAGGRETLFRWSVQLHNTVNGQLGKRVIPYEEAKTFWMNVANGKEHCFPSEATASSGKANMVSAKKSFSVCDLLWILIWFIFGFLVSQLILFTSRALRKN